MTAGTVLGRIGETDELAPHVHFAIRPAGRGAPKIDPKPILDGWKLLEATAIYRAAGKNPFDGTATAGQVLLMSKTQLIERVLTDPSLEIYACGREDIRTGQIDRRVLAMLEYLVARGFRPDAHLAQVRPLGLHDLGQRLRPLVPATRSTSPQINGLPMLGNQGPGSITEAAGPRPAAAPGDDGAVPDHLADGLLRRRQHLRDVRPRRPRPRRLHAGRRTRVEGSVSKQFSAMLKPEQWERLIDRLGEIDNPEVPTEALRRRAARRQGQEARTTRASSAHLGRVAGPSRDAALPLRPARARRHGRARGRPLPRAATRSASWSSGSPAPRRRHGGGSAARSPRTPIPAASPPVPLTTLTAIRPDDARRRRASRRPGSPGCATTTRRSRPRSTTRCG